jgi:adenylate cyclase
MSAWRQLVDELKRRRVVRVAVVYGAAAFAVLQAADILVPALHLPPWTVTFVVVLLALGLPVALALAWVLELTPDGIRVTASGMPAPGAPAPALIGRRTVLAAGALVLAGIAFGAGWVLRPDAGRADVANAGGVSVAVLPFADLSDDRSQEYFGDGIAEELLNILRASDVAVASRTSSFAFKGRGMSVREIAAQLGVDHIIDGSVRKAGSRLRISAQVIDVRSDRQLWSDRFDRDADDIFRIQEEIAAAVASALRVQLAGGATASGTRSAAAYDLYLLGLHHWNQRTPDGLQRAIDVFTEATQHDPAFARAWAGLSFAYSQLPAYTDHDPERARIQARAAAERALQLDSLNAETRTAYAAAFLQGAAAIREYDRAIELDPTFPTAHHWRGMALIRQGELAAGEAALRRALQLDPSSLPAQSFLAIALDLQRRTEEALAEVESLLARAPGYRNALIQSFDYGAQLGRAREFEPRLRDWLRIIGEDTAYAAVIVNGIEDPRRREPAIVTALRVVASHHGTVRTNAVSLVALLRAREPTLELLETDGLPFLDRPLFDFVRDDPRFHAMLARRAGARAGR